MARTNVFNLTRDRHADETILSLVATWRVARAEAQLIWAKQDLDTLFSTRDFAADDAPSDFLDAVNEAESHLATMRPKTTLGAKVMLDVVLDILTHRAIKPEETLSEGPILEIVTNVARALGSSDALI